MYSSNPCNRENSFNRLCLVSSQNTSIVVVKAVLVLKLTRRLFQTKNNIMCTYTGFLTGDVTKIIVWDLQEKTHTILCQMNRVLKFSS